jgi:Mn2+/Fe2+ NRAMP family transporter
LDVDKKKEIKNQDDTSSYDDKLDVVPSSSKSSFFPFKEVIKSLGPGIITGAANEDPTTVAAYSQAGARFGFGMLWLALFQYPMLAVFQEMCARIGLVTDGGLAAAIKYKYPKEGKQLLFYLRALFLLQLQ